MRLEGARVLADKVCKVLAPFCERVEVAGSIRRGRSEVGDIDIVALPKVVAADVNQRGAFNLKYYDVSRRILRMNKRLHLETGKCLFEKRGHHWALTRFAFDSYDEPIEQVSEVSAAGPSGRALDEEL